MNIDATSILDPSLLALWTRAIRGASHWSQEALAESSNLTVRTIQRVEAGQPSNITTRRALARGLGYDNPDVFFDPQFAKKIAEFATMIEQIGKEVVAKRFPDRIRLKATRIQSGEQLGRLMMSLSRHLTS